MPGTKVLVVDDEEGLVSLLKRWLEEAGYEAYGATDGEGGLELFFEQSPALSIIDLRMPGMNGFQVVSRIRESSDAHLLVLTAFDNEEYIIRGLELGADEYLIKPVSKRVFLARVDALLRRAVTAEEIPSAYSDASLTLDLLTHDVYVRSQPVHLAPTEFRLLAFLTQHSDPVVGHEELLDCVWGDHGGSLDSLKWHVSTLREKVEEDPKVPRLIVTVPKVGYRYCPPGSHPGTELPGGLG